MDNRSFPTLASLRLSHFRNYESSEIEPHPGINLFVGQNAQGKTNLLESIHLLSTGRLLRGSRDAQGIRAGESLAEVEGVLSGSGTTITVQFDDQKRRKKSVKLNGVGLPRASDIIGRLPSVSFSTSDLSIVRGEPADRRSFLDTELAQLYPAYLNHLTDYKKALHQRNVLLKQAQEAYVEDALFEVWEEQLAIHGSEIRKYRQGWIEDLLPRASEEHKNVSSGEVLVMTYVAKDEAGSADEMLQAMEEVRGLDVRRGSGSIGPHRDDVLIEIDEKEARTYGSQGQQRTAVLSIKLATLESGVNILGVPPVLLLDDVFSDLDQSRRHNLISEALKLGGQVFITCTETEQVGVDLMDASKVFRVRSGTVT